MKKITMITLPTKLVRINERTQVVVLATVTDEEAIARYHRRITPPIKPPGRLHKVKKEEEEVEDPEVIPEVEVDVEEEE